MIFGSLPLVLGLGDDLDLLEGARHASDEEVLFELGGELHDGDAVGVVAPVVAFANGPKRCQVPVVQVDEFPPVHRQQVVDVFCRPPLPLEGDPHPSGSLERGPYRGDDLLPHGLPPVFVVSRRHIRLDTECTQEAGVHVLKTL